MIDSHGLASRLRLLFALSVLSAFACQRVGAAVLEEFLFTDAAGTAIEAAANNAGTGNLFDVDADLVDVKTNGSGQLNASLKANNDFGTTYVDTAVVSSGELYGVMELSFDFEAATFEAGEEEEIRLSLIQFDPRSTFVTAEFELQREADNSVSFFGNGVGTGSLDTPTVSLAPSQVSLVAVVSADLDSDFFQVHYSTDGGASFTTLKAGLMDPARGVESLRLTLNNNLSQDSVLIDRIALLDTNPYPGLIPDISSIPEPSSLCLASFCLMLSRVRRRME